ncbi:MAG: VOC family protein [Anaerolineae bacterium]|nr:VOC family protein [Anaerolineae bacterium]
MDNRIFWLEMASTDIPATVKFYQELLGWPIVRDEEMDYTMTAFERGETGVGFSPIDEEQDVTPGSVLVYVDVPDVDATIARAKELGAPIIVDKTEIPTVGWMAIFGDPGGNRIGVMQSMPREE